MQTPMGTLSWELIIIVLFACCVSPSTARGERLPVKTYTVADGLMRDTVFRVRQDSRGFLWFCTAEGISRFDGTAMTNFTVADGLPDRFVQDFLETRNGTVYIATGKGLARLNPQGFRGSTENPLFEVFRPEDPKAERILTLFEDKAGQVWAGSSNGPYKLHENDGQTTLERVSLGISEAEQAVVTEVIEDRRGFFWVGTGIGLFCLAPDGGVVRRMTKGDRFDSNTVSALLEDREGQIWVGFRGGAGLCLVDPQTIEVKECFNQKDGLTSSWVTDILQTTDANIWISTVAGVCLWQGPVGGGSVCKTYAVKNDMCVGTSSLAEDKDGNLWTGSDCGAKRVARYGFTTFTSEDGLDDLEAGSIFENQAGELFVINNPSGGRKISRFEGDRFSTVAPRLSEKVGYYGWGWQQTVLQDSRGAWWIPAGNAVFRTPEIDFEDLGRVTAEKIFSRPNKEVFRLFEDSRGDVWISLANSQVWRWERSTGVWHDHSEQVQLSPDRLVSAFVEDNEGSVWIGTGSDHSLGYYQAVLIRYRNGDFRRFTEDEGAPRGWTRDLFVDSRGRVWIASTEDGLLRLDEPRAGALEFVRYTTEVGLTSNATTSVTEDRFGRIYVGMWRGIDRLTPETGQIENFTTADGLPGSFVEVAYRDRNDDLWFATKSGLTRFRPEPVRDRVPPTILVTGLQVDGEPQAVSILGESEVPPLELGSNQNQIGVSFLGLGASLGEKLKYEYRLTGEEWTPTVERSLNFANLAPGDYRFEVRASTADRIYSNAPAVVSFRIAAPIWQRPWFLILLAAAVAGSIYLIYRYRLQRLLDLERVRTRIATDLHDDIGANLTRIAILSEVAHQRFGHLTNGNDELLPSIAQISRESVSSMGDIVWAINPKKDTLQDLMRRMRQHAREVLEERDIGLDLYSPETAAAYELRLDANTRRGIYLIFKEALNNIVRHAKAESVEIDLKIMRSRFELKITDNGIGFAPDREYDGNGLLSMKKRASDFGGRLEISSVPGQGTTIILWFDL